MKLSFVCLLFLMAVAFSQTTGDALPDPNVPDGGGFIAGAPYRIMAGSPYDLTAAIAWARERKEASDKLMAPEPPFHSAGHEDYLEQHKLAQARLSQLQEQKTALAPIELVSSTVYSVEDNGIILQSGYPNNVRLFIRHFPKDVVATGDFVSFLAVPDKIIRNRTTGEALHSYDFGLTPEQVAAAAKAAVPAATP